MTTHRNPANLAAMNRNALRELARERGIPLRLTKGAMISALMASEAGDPHRERQGLHARPVKFYHPGDPLEGQKLPSGRSLLTTSMARSRFFRRHQVHEAPHPSRNPRTPQWIVTKVKKPAWGAMVPYVAPRAADGTKIKDWR